jgi:hypothetical protein
LPASQVVAFCDVIYFLFLQDQIKGIIINAAPSCRSELLLQTFRCAVERAPTRAGADTDISVGEGRCGVGVGVTRCGAGKRLQGPMHSPSFTPQPRGRQLVDSQLVHSRVERGRRARGCHPLTLGACWMFQSDDNLLFSIPTFCLCNVLS